MRNPQGPPGCITVHMFGGFTISYEGREIVLARSSSVRFVQLLQIVWLQGDRGITKEKLVEELYDGEEITNINSSFNTLVYRMRQQMKQAGLPEADYVVRRKGLYLPDERIPVWVDALEFERLIRLGDQAGDEKEKYSCYREAFDLYRGELLPDAAGEVWAFDKSVAFKELFGRCASWLGEYARGARDYQMMEMVYGKAAAIYPLEEWETGVMDAVIAKGEFRKARELYDRTARLYSDGLGLPPPEKMLESYKRMSEELAHSPGTLEEILGLLREQDQDGGDRGGAYYCSFPSFVDVYRLLSRSMERSGISAYMILCTLVDHDGNVLRGGEELMQSSDALRRAIQTSLRPGDVFSRYSASQYLICVMNVRQEDCGTIFQRIHGRLNDLTARRSELRWQAQPVAGT